MDFNSLLPVIALLIGAAIIVLVLLRLMRARSRAAAEPPHPAAPVAPTLSKAEEEYLDSSHILPSGSTASSEAAARAAAALHEATRKPK